jgi:hypothetical protein
MNPTLTIDDLLRVPVERQDHEWLIAALQAALRLELATIPPYLAAYWSIKDREHLAARSILSVVKDEMLHMGLVCNLLIAIGGRPILSRSEALPTYPTALPGGIRPGLVVPLEGFSKEMAKRFMDIEMPQEAPDAEGVETGVLTIGTFYSAIQTLFDTLAPPLTVEGQLDDFLGLFKIESASDVTAALNLIKRQGEGAAGGPEDVAGELSHYYRFAEIFHGRRFRRDPATGKWAFDGDHLDFPDTWPMVRVPPDGYGEESGEAWTLIEKFDKEFSTVMLQLDDAWRTGDQSTLELAVRTMSGALSRTAVELMQMPHADGGTYGPCFRLRATS